MADDPLQELRFRCRRCGVYPSELVVGHRTRSVGETLLTIPIKPRFWDDGHREDQTKALQRVQQRRHRNSDDTDRSKS